jgi:hypothetical protein
MLPRPRYISTMFGAFALALALPVSATAEVGTPSTQEVTSATEEVVEDPVGAVEAVVTEAEETASGAAEEVTGQVEEAVAGDSDAGEDTTADGSGPAPERSADPGESGSTEPSGAIDSSQSDGDNEAATDTGAASGVEGSSGDQGSGKGGPTQKVSDATRGIESSGSGKVSVSSSDRLSRFTRLTDVGSFVTSDGDFSAILGAPDVSPLEQLRGAVSQGGNVVASDGREPRLSLQETGALTLMLLALSLALVVIGRTALAYDRRLIG